MYILCAHIGGSIKDVKVTVLRQIRVISRGQVIAEIAPPSAAKADAEAARKRLRGSVRRYEPRSIR